MTKRTKKCCEHFGCDSLIRQTETYCVFHRSQHEVAREKRIRNSARSSAAYRIGRHVLDALEEGSQMHIEDYTKVTSEWALGEWRGRTTS